MWFTTVNLAGLSSQLLADPTLSHFPMTPSTDPEAQKVVRFPKDKGSERQSKDEQGKPQSINPIRKSGVLFVIY